VASSSPQASPLQDFDSHFPEFLKDFSQSTNPPQSSAAASGGTHAIAEGATASPPSACTVALAGGGAIATKGAVATAAKPRGAVAPSLALPTQLSPPPPRAEDAAVAKREETPAPDETAVSRVANAVAGPGEVEKATPTPMDMESTTAGPAGVGTVIAQRSGLVEQTRGGDAAATVVAWRAREAGECTQAAPVDLERGSRDAGNGEEVGTATAGGTLLAAAAEEETPGGGRNRGEGDSERTSDSGSQPPTVRRKRGRPAGRGSLRGRGAKGPHRRLSSSLFPGTQQNTGPQRPSKATPPCRRGHIARPPVSPLRPYLAALTESSFPPSLPARSISCGPACCSQATCTLTRPYTQQSGSSRRAHCLVRPACRLPHCCPGLAHPANRRVLLASHVTCLGERRFTCPAQPHRWGRPCRVAAHLGRLGAYWREPSLYAHKHGTPTLGGGRAKRGQEGVSEGATGSSSCCAAWFSGAACALRSSAILPFAWFACSSLRTPFSSLSRAARRAATRASPPSSQIRSPRHHPQRPSSPLRRLSSPLHPPVP